MVKVNRKIYYFFVAILILMCISLFASSRLFSTSTPWVYLGPENYRLVPSGEGNFVVFDALQDIDARKIIEARSGIMIDSGVEIVPGDNNDNITLEEMRGKIIPALKFYAITPENTLQEISEKDTFEIPFPWKNEGQVEEKLKIIRLHFDDKDILSEDEPEFSSFIPSPDNTSYLIERTRDLWLFEKNTVNMLKISSDTYNGKTYEELSVELLNYIRSKGIEGPVTLLWNDNPIFSPDSSKITYITNRDCITGGNSIWAYDFLTKKEHPLIKNEEGEYYSCDGWLDSTHLVTRKYFQNDKVSFLIVDSNGFILPLNLEGKDPYILSVSDQGLITYTPDYLESREIMAIKINQDGSSTELYRRTVDGILRFYGSKLISSDSTKIAYLYVPDNDETSQNLVVAYLKNNKEIIIEIVPIKGKIYNFNWLDGNRLLVHTVIAENGMNEISSWVYNIEGGQS